MKKTITVLAENERIPFLATSQLTLAKLFICSRVLLKARMLQYVYNLQKQACSGIEKGS
jgi:hypothetical protein